MDTGQPNTTTLQPIDFRNIGAVIQASEMFEDSTQHEIEILIPYAKAFHVKKNQVILKEGKPGGYLFLVIAGRIDIFKKPELFDSKDPEKITEVGPGKSLGEISVIDELPFSATGIAACDSTVILFSREAFDSLLQNHPHLYLKFYRRLCRIMSLRLRKTTDMLGACLSSAAGLTVALDEAIKANALKNRFFAETTHELRTPLNAILGYGELLEQKAKALEYSGLIKPAQRIQKSGWNLLELINQLLDLSKLEAGKMELHLEDFDIYCMVENTLEVVSPLLVKRGNKFELVCDETIGFMHADSTKLHQALLNLLSNANKFTHQGLIQLEIVAHSESQWIHFRVTDTGVGMSPEHLAELFTPYSQGDSGISKNFGGTGLGLAISQNFCALMGGHIEVESKLGQGACFTIKLPRQVTPGSTPGMM